MPRALTTFAPPVGFENFDVTPLPVHSQEVRREFGILSIVEGLDGVASRALERNPSFAFQGGDISKRYGGSYDPKSRTIKILTIEGEVVVEDFGTTGPRLRLVVDDTRMLTLKLSTTIFPKIDVECRYETKGAWSAEQTIDGLNLINDVLEGLAICLRGATDKYGSLRTALDSFGKKGLA